MSESTQDMLAWLNQRFRMTDSEGIYHAHQPIYGFRKGHCEPSSMRRYSVTYQLAKALSQIKFDSLLDVGGAEGYKAALIRDLFGAQVTSCDISEEACARATEIFGVSARQAEVHSLPFEDGSFDVVTSSETLEHVPEIDRAVRELLRVARKAVVITVPQESEEEVEHEKLMNPTHAHLYSLNAHSFDFLKADGVSVVCRGMGSRQFLKVFGTIEAGKLRSGGRNKIVSSAINLSVRCLRAFWNVTTSSLGLVWDDRISNRGDKANCSSLLFVFIKDSSSYSEQPVKPVTARRILNFRVPFYRMQSSTEEAVRG